MAPGARGGDGFGRALTGASRSRAGAGRIALVTGASSGIGRGLAIRLAREGWSVALVGRRAEALEEVSVEIRSLGGRALPLRCDVSIRTEVVAAVDRCEAEWGPVDLLVANAGISQMTLVDDLSADHVEFLCRVNYLGAVYAVEAVLPGMLARRSGHLVAMSSLVAFGGLPLTAAYSASKAALTNFFESLRIDLADAGVAVSTISPGYVRTDMTARNAHGMPFLVELDDAVDRIYRAISARRRSYAFPWQLASIIWIGQIFPRWLYDRLAARVKRSKAE